MSSKSSAYQSILKKQLENEKKNKKKNKAASAVRICAAICTSYMLSTSVYLQSAKHVLAQVPRKRLRPVPESESDTDDYVVSASELKRARTEARYWRHRYEEVFRKKAQLTYIVETISGTINGQLATGKYKYGDLMFIIVPVILMNTGLGTGGALDRKSFR